MLKRIVAPIVAGIFFLATPNFATAQENFLSSTPPEGVPWSITDDERRPTNSPPQSEPPEGVPRSIDPNEPPRTYEPSETPPQPVEPLEPSKPVTPPQPFEPPQDEVEGLEFLMYNQNGVMAFAVIADHEKYQLRPVLAHGKVPGRATVLQMNSPDAIATINASYFGKSGVLYGNTKIDGVTAGTTYYIRSAMGIFADGSTIFARQIYRGSLIFNGNEVIVNGVNCERETDSVVVYNGWYGASTGTNKFGVELVVRDGTVENISRDEGNSFIPPDGFVVSANGAAAKNFDAVQVGDRFKFEEDYINVEYTGDFNEAIHIVGAGPTLVKGGKIYVTADAEQFPPDIRVGRAPRSAVGITQYGDYILAVVDGRQSHSKGCTLTEWARILRDNFGAVEAINLDGGGSTELVFKGSLVNSPSDGHERPVGDALTIVRR
ncbi:MAG: phosphodiester glycosidase family protein [Selenomonadaceae bacterium]|nr:phosphodiester glycosidase family protein [Selenomonadaceae bacterium]